jgi:hypothetical protein
MPRYEVAVSTPAAAAAAAYCGLIGNGTRRVFLRELQVTVEAATASSVGVLRPNNTPVQTTTAVPQPEDPADAAAAALLGTAWSTPPAIGANVFMRKIVIPATIGAGIIWTWPGAGSDKALVIAGGVNSLVLWNYGGGAGSVLSAVFVLEE